MAISSIVKTKRDGTLTLSDLAAAESLVVGFEAGDLSITIPGPGVTNILDRGQMPSPTPSLRYADDAPMTATFTANLRDLSDAAYATLFEVISQTGKVASTWVSTLGANAEVFAIDVGFVMEGTDHGDASDHSLTLPHCVMTGSISEGDPNSISLSLTSYSVYPTNVV